MQPNGIITLLTDFGYRDSFVGSMKGVILNINPQARIVDIAHDIPTGDIKAAGFVLHGAYHYFPAGTIHTVVVDPGVGSIRKAIAAQVGKHFFVAPDNGILSWIFADGDEQQVVDLINEEYHLPKVSHTFHGRDVFAPVAAHLSKGIPLEKLGESITDFVKQSPNQPYKKGNVIQGEVIYIDRFGNLITNISADLLEKSFPLGQFRVKIGEHIIAGLSTSYADVQKNQALAIIGSFELLEIAVRDGNAAERLNALSGTQILVKI